jgi:hypothetical protein
LCNGGANGQVIDIMKNYIRHRLYPQKIAENEEKNKLRN